MNPATRSSAPHASAATGPGWFVLGVVLGAARELAGRLGPPCADKERGDVPGWVLITLMTAGLVTMLWAVAGAQLTELFTSALAAVTGPTR